VKRLLHSTLATISVVLVFAVSVGAQIPAAVAPPPGVFGGARPDAAATTRLDFTTSVVEGYDTDVPVSLRSTIIDPSSQQSVGFSTSLSTSAEYLWRNGRTQIGMSGSSVVKHYSDLGQTRGVGSGLGVGMSTRLPGSYTVFVNQAVAYTPAHLYGVFPTGAAVEPGTAGETAPDYTVSDFNSYIYTSTVSLKRDFSQRNSLAASGDFQYTDRQVNSPLWQDVTARRFGGEFVRKVSRNVAVATQYRYRSGAFGYTNDLLTTEHSLDFGLNYIKPLSLTRRATLRLNFGVAAADVPQSTQAGNLIFRQYMGTGSADFEYQFQRTWRAKANYRRGIEYIVDIPEPVYANSLGLAIDGFVTRRVDLVVSGGYSSGESLLNSSALAYDTYTGSIRVRYALSRLSAMYAEYMYYFYDFAQGTPLLVGVPPALERHGVRAGFTLWMPALRK